MAMRSDWFSCDGTGGAGPRSESTTGRLAGPSRRSFLVGLGLGSLAWALPRTALSQIAVDPRGRSRSVVVSIFLRGGADGLNIVAPYAEDGYHRNRPALRLHRPHEGAPGERVLDLDGFFGFHPALAPALPLFRDGKLAIVHAAGSGDQTRSHFEAMNTMERGLAAGSQGSASGWLARYLAISEPAQPSPLRAVAFGGTMPDSLRGGTSAIAVDTLDDFRLDCEHEPEMRAALRDLYGSGKDAMAQAGAETLQVLETLNRLDPKHYRPSHGATYPDSDLGRALMQVGLLIRAEIGLEIAVLDKGGWDTHVAQGNLLGPILQDLGAALAAFDQDLGTEMNGVTVVVQTEFGRRLKENSGLGTDHGRASVMFAMGGGVRGGRVIANWPGLEETQLEPPGDLRMTTDYRRVLAEVLDHRYGAASGRVFEGMSPAPVGLFG